MTNNTQVPDLTTQAVFPTAQVAFPREQAVLNLSPWISKTNDTTTGSNKTCEKRASPAAEKNALT
jgi:hypothetical protein